MAQLAFEGVTKVFADGTEAVRDFDLDVGDGELMILVGPSGSGKSTALRMLAGLEDATAGTIRIGDRVVNDVAPKDRDIAMVFQSYALYPHMDVARNLGFALKMQRMQRASIAERVSAAAQRLGLSDLVAKRPRNLSGGQRQRVALGRAIVREPQAFLMDEPLSNLDAKLRVEMRGYLSRLRQELGTTTVYVTHDQVEAMTMGDRVAVMRDGRLVQCDRPQELYDRPADLFVASFIGSPEMNLARGRVERDDDELYLVLGSQRLHLPGALPDAVLARGDAPVVVGIRPEALSHAAAGRDDEQVLEVTVELVESLGSDLLVHAAVDAPAVLTEDQLEVAREVGGDPAADLVRARFTARLTPDVPVAAGDRLRLHTDMEHLHFFDPDTTLALR
ncbi:MAG TPA: sn-glycerol-3-phosphate ABC transporter ATP-binding protein UgpC [Solirubrobacteraceae bacterium]|nr:sn-glycerol-3-phosphate ABC transporter ATP-binding protein UgpC [Solirubrobacteraceae bacterium]